MDAPQAYVEFDAALGTQNTGPPVPYKGAKPSAAEHDTARDVMEEDREEVGDEEQREESDREVGDNEPEEDAVSIHLPEEEELWVNCVANHPT